MVFMLADNHLFLYLIIMDTLGTLWVITYETRKREINQQGRLCHYV